MKARKDIIAMGTKIGAAFGGLAFLFFGIIPGFYYGRYGTLVLLNNLFDGPVEPTVLVRIVVAAGIIIGIASVASLSLVVGAIIGTIIGYITEMVSRLFTAKETTTEPVKAN
ncbi:MAG TPA: hypothetical protein DEP99_03415 [Nitrospiraceae bacterium]|nr:hypothetical protein [Nitrospiraceae bacterium]